MARKASLRTGFSSPNGAVDPQRSAAMKGNKNASRNKADSGRTLGAAGTAALGGIGAAATGYFVGKNRSNEAIRRHRKSSTITNMIPSAIYGGAAGSSLGPAGIAAGALIGSAVGALGGYAGSRAGTALGQYSKKRKANKK